MNQSGQEAAIYGIIFALVGIIGLYLFLAMWSPIVGQLLPFLDNSDTIQMGGVAKLFIMLIPLILVFVLILGLLLHIKGEKPPGQYYG